MDKKLILYHIETNIEYCYITAHDAVKSLQQVNYSAINNRA